MCAILDSEEKIEEVIFEKEPSAVLFDIKLNGNIDGIDIAHMIRRQFSIPVVFFTSSSDLQTIERVKDTSPDGYIIKPFTKDVLITTIVLAISNYRKKENLQKETELEAAAQMLPDSIFIRDKGYLRKITISDIDWIKGDGSYTHIATTQSAYTLRNYLRDVMRKLPGYLFCKINKAYIVNINKIEAINSKEIIINGKTFPVGRNYYQEIVTRLNQISQ